MISDPRFFFLCAAGFIAGIYLFIKGFIFLKDKHLIENIPTSKIDGIAMGLVEVYGEVLPFKKLVKSPFSNSDCAYCTYTVEEYVSSGKSSHWHTILQGEVGDYFYIKDDTGKVLINPSGSTFSVPMDKELNSGIGNSPSENVQEFLKGKGISFTGFLGGNKTMRFREYFLAPGDKVFVFGTAAENSLSQDENKNHVDKIMIQKGNYEKFYFISDSNEKTILKSFAWKSLFGIFGGAALSIFCLYIMLLNLGIL